MIQQRNPANHLAWETGAGSCGCVSVHATFMQLHMYLYSPSGALGYIHAYIFDAVMYHSPVDHFVEARGRNETIANFFFVFVSRISLFVHEVQHSKGAENK